MSQPRHPGHAVEAWSIVYLTTGDVWTNASSNDLKGNIETLSNKGANATLAAFSPVRYAYRNSRDEVYVSYIAEGVPDLVATNDHKSLSQVEIAGGIFLHQATRVTHPVAVRGFSLLK